MSIDESAISAALSAGMVTEYGERSEENPLGVIAEDMDKFGAGLAPGIVTALEQVGSSPWVDFDPILNSWTNYGGVYSTAQYRADSLVSVSLRGHVSKASLSGSSNIFQLPMDYRPAYAQRFCIPIVNGSAVYGVDTVLVSTTGYVLFENRLGSSSITWLSLDGIRVFLD